MENFGYYIMVLVCIIIGFFVLKKVAGCLIKTIITGILIAILAAVYYFYFRQ